ncbi:MAG: MarR family transcriptional regulator [Dehalococcoidia bacterium]|nr:MarR family transcriptional regulator [Dehalococcoidia bacterium]MDH4291417.1 MarR family transcriptional regulator [Dehalococcoidia bacterium]
MAMNSESENTVLRLWLLLRRVGDSLALCQDSVFSKYGLTTEQFGVLASIKSRGPLRPSDLASILERGPNSMSMLVDRMVKAGLVRRTRDKKDRRTVTVSLTSKGENAVEPAIPAGWEFIHKTLSPLSFNDQRTFASMLETVRCELVGYLNPEMDMAEIVKDSFTNRPDLYKRMVKNIFRSGSKAKRQAAKKGNAR